MSVSNLVRSEVRSKVLPFLYCSSTSGVRSEVRSEVRSKVRSKVRTENTI